MALSPESERCKACGKALATEPVQILNGPRYSGAQWVESGIRRCMNSECFNTTGGTLEEQLAYIDGVHGYKYFGDYPLSPEELDAVGTAIGLAKSLPDKIATARSDGFAQGRASLEERVRDLEVCLGWLDRLNRFDSRTHDHIRALLATPGERENG